jgi:hypothetical protein
MTLPLIDLPAGGVHTQPYAEGVITRADLQVGDLLGGDSLGSHGSELAEVAEITPRCVWLISILEPRVAALTRPLSSEVVRRSGRFFPWAGLRALRAPQGGAHALLRLRLAPEVRSPAENEYFLTSQGELLTSMGGHWHRLGVDSQWRKVALPIGAELFSLAAALPR